MNTDGNVQIEIPSKVLNAAFGKVMHAVASDNARPILGCVLFEGDERGLRLIAADNYRIAIADVATDEFSGWGRITIQRDQVLILRAFLAKYSRDVTLRHADATLTATDGTDTVTLRLFEGMYPNYRAAITDVPVVRSVVHANPKYLMDALKAVKNATAARIEIPTDNELLTVMVKAEGYSEYVMPIRVAGEGYTFGSEAEKADPVAA